MTDLEEARRGWLRERPAFEQFGKELVITLKSALKKAGIYGEISSRAKDVDSVLRKLNLKRHHTLDTLGDKCGVRIVLRHKDEIEPVMAIAEQYLECANRENKVGLLDFKQVGYLSTHVDVRFKGDAVLAGTYPPEKFSAELQVRTLAQHLWSEMSHDAIYKNDETLNPLPVPLKRRIYLLAGVVEVADDEFNRLNEEMKTVPEFEILRSLERHYFKLTARRGDQEVSLDLIRRLMPLYNESPARIAAHLDEFYEKHEHTLRQVYDEAEEVADRSAYLFQPEALMIYDLLETDAARTRQVWNDGYPEPELERIAVSFGISFD